MTLASRALHTSASIIVGITVWQVILHHANLESNPTLLEALALFLGSIVALSLSMSLTTAHETASLFRAHYGLKKKD